MTLKKIVCLLIFILSLSPAFGQKWANAGIPLSVSQIRAITVDTITNRLFTGGQIPVDINGNNAFCIYNGANWTVKDTIDNLVRAMTIYNNELYMGGDFIKINSQPMEYLAKWNGTNWINIGTSGGGILNLRVINNELYAVGTFTQIGGVNANSIAKWNGSNWVSFNLPGPKFVGNPIYVTDCAVYNGELYAAGNFELANGPNDISVLKAGVWQRVGNNGDSLRGSFSGIQKMEIYNNELYIAGLILHWEGNVGNGIQRWNGSYWKPVGTGVQGVNNSINSDFCQIFDMVKYKGKLIIGGNFSFSGNSVSPSLASWDGIKWCAIDTLIDKPITAFGIFRDTIYVGTSSIFEGINVNSFAKFIAGDYSYTEKCSINFDVGLNELSVLNQISFYPNPALSTLNIIDEQNQFQNSIIHIKNTLGQTILSFPFKPEIDVSALANGVYFLQIKTEDKKLLNAKFIKE